ncbi:MAG: ABC transporter substrate-binding protein, partial [Candidatus Zipacnadales bacterium]
YEVVDLIFDRLVRFDGNLQIHPELAKSWEVSKDGLTWTLFLRDDVKFHDGTPFNAQAVKAHVERMLDRDWALPNRALWDHITSVNVVDDYTVQFVTAKPFGPMLFYMAHGSGGIVSPAAVEKWGKDFAEHPVGTGPYKVESFTPGVEVVLVQNTEYWGSPAPLDRIVVKTVVEPGARVAMLETGEAHIIDQVPVEEVDRLTRNPSVKILQQTGLRTFCMQFFLDRPTLQDLKVRQALNHAVDVQTIVDTIFLGQGKPLDSPVSSAIPGHVSVGRYDYDPGKAKSLLNEAGWSDTNGDGIVDKGGEPLRLKILYSTAYPKEEEVVEAVRQYLADVGVELELWEVERGGVRTYQKVSRKEVQYDIANWGFNPSNGDITYHLESSWVSNPDDQAPPYMWNLSWYSKPEVDDLLLRTKFGEEAVDPNKRVELLAEAQRIIWNDAPALWLYSLEILAATRANVEGVVILPTIFLNLREARFSE